jgi:hypothetical protein
MGGCKKLMLFFGGFVCFWARGLETLLLFLYVTEVAGRIDVWDIPWPLAAECNMITNKRTKSPRQPAGRPGPLEHW